MRLASFLRYFPFRLAALCAAGLVVLAFLAGFTIKNLLERDRADLTRAVAESARSIAKSYDERAKKGEFTQDEAKERVRSAVRDIRYLGNQYVFVIDVQGVMQVHGVQPQREGRNFAHEVDANGVDFAASLRERAVEGGGFTFYHFPKPGSDAPLPKVAYSTLYEPWNWVFGTGIYIDDVDRLFWRSVRNFILFSAVVTVFTSIMAYFASRQLMTEIERRRRAEKEALHASKLASIGQLAAGLAHEINTPAQYVGDNLRYLGDEEKSLLKAVMEGTTLSESEAAIVSDELSAAVKEGLEGVERITRIVSSLKSFAVQGDSESSHVDVNKALEDTLTISQHTWQAVAKVETQFAPNLPRIRCHPGEINQAFLNFILNAGESIKSCASPSPGLISIGTSEEKGYVVIVIADSGRGVPDELRERIFDPFFTTKPVGQGTGQGLAICRDIIEVKLKGRIEVGGDPKRGAVFTIRLPASRGA